MKKQKKITAGILLFMCCGYLAARGQTMPRLLQESGMRTTAALSFIEKYKPADAAQGVPAEPKILLSPVMHLPEDYYFRHCGYFCRLEIRAQKKLGIPLTFRLGDLQYVDRLEGKDGGNAR